MYRLSDQQIAFILDDIRRRGIELEDLQSNLLDHICCIIEEQLEENGDFGQFYETVIIRFYRKELKEVEEETISLLTFNNYYKMKKIMLGSGVSAAAFMMLGIVLKFMHAPGSAASIGLGIILFSLIFLPLLLTLRIRERKAVRDRVIAVAGIVSGIMLSLGVWFKIMHWPGANVLGLTSILMIIFLYSPIYFFTNIRRAENKENVIVTSLVILMSCGLFLTLIRTNYAQQRLQTEWTKEYYQQEQLLQHERELSSLDSGTALVKESHSIDQLCEQLKHFILRVETGSDQLPEDFESSNKLIGESLIREFILSDSSALGNMNSLSAAISDYNQKRSQKMAALSSNLEFKDIHSMEALQGVVRIQLALLQNSRCR